MSLNQTYELCQFYECTRPATMRLHFANDVLMEQLGGTAYCTQHADVVRVRVSKPRSRVGRVVREERLDTAHYEV